MVSLFFSLYAGTECAQVAQPSHFLLAVILLVRLLYYDFEGGNLIPLLAIGGAVFTFFLIFCSSTFPR